MAVEKKEEFVVLKPRPETSGCIAYSAILSDLPVNQLRDSLGPISQEAEFENFVSFDRVSDMCPALKD